MKSIVLVSAMISGAGYLGLVPATMVNAGTPAIWAAGVLITTLMVLALAKA